MGAEEFRWEQCIQADHPRERPGLRSGAARREPTGRGALEVLLGIRDPGTGLGPGPRPRGLPCQSASSDAATTGAANAGGIQGCQAP